MKIILQKISLKQWGQAIPENLATNRIIIWLPISINCPYFQVSNDDPIVSYEFHGFSDASPEAYSAFVYVKTIS